MQNSANPDPNAKNDRKLERHEFLLPVPAVDAASGETLGALVNISIEGLMLMSNQALETNRLYQVTLALPEAISGHSEIELGVDCLWTRDDEQFGHHWSGFQIIDASQDAIKVIEQLIRDYSESAS